MKNIIHLKQLFEVQQIANDIKEFSWNTNLLYFVQVCRTLSNDFEMSKNVPLNLRRWSKDF